MLVISAARRSLPSTENVELHHILPKSFSMGGDRDEHNIVPLTVREHFIAHQLLCRFTSGQHYYKMRYALACFQGRSSLTSRQFAAASLRHLPKSVEHKAALSRASIGRPGLVGELNPMFGKMGENHPRFGLPGPMTDKTHTNEAKSKIGAKSKGRQTMLGKSHSNETKQLMSQNNGMKRDPYAAARVRWTEAEREKHRQKMKGSGNANAKHWIITYPDGASIVTTDLKQFCVDNQWKYQSVMSCRNGGKTYKKCIIDILSDPLTS